MSAEAFIDTNIFIYQPDTTDGRKTGIAGGIIRRAVVEGSGCISFQVTQETLNAVLRKAEVALDTESAHRYVDVVMAPLFRVPATLDLDHRALEIRARYRYGFYDSNIIAAALVAGCKRLYSEDFQGGQQIEGLTIENPFAA